MSRFEHAPKRTPESIIIPGKSGENEVRQPLDFTYNHEDATASVLLPDGTDIRLENVSVVEPDIVLSIVTGTDKFTSKETNIEVIEHNNQLEVIKVTVDNITVYEPTKH